MQPAEPMLDLSGWSAWLVLPAFTGAAGVIGVAGTRLAGVADELADATGLGEAVFGALLIGGATSLPGLTVSVVAGLQGQADLAVSNALHPSDVDRDRGGAALCPWRLATSWAETPSTRCS